MSNATFVFGTTHISELPEPIIHALDERMYDGDMLLVGDAPGTDTLVQDYLKLNDYRNVIVFYTGTDEDKPRYLADSKWNTVSVIPDDGCEPGSREFYQSKDKVMADIATFGLAVPRVNGSKSTIRNIRQMLDRGQVIIGYLVNKYGWDDPGEFCVTDLQDFIMFEKYYYKGYTTILRLLLANQI